MLSHFLALVLGLILSALVLLGFEVYARRHEPAASLVDVNICRDLRRALGGGFLPKCQCRWKRTKARRLVFNVGFQTDSYRRRVTPQSEGRTNLIAFFGCSFTLGAGVDDRETLPARFAALATDHRCLNYGGSGFGPEHTLVQIDKLIREHELGTYIGQPLAVYTMIPGHVGRAAGSFEILGTFGRYFPAYSLDPTGNLVHLGTMEEAYPFSTWLATKSALVRRIPSPTNQASVELMARILLKAKVRWRERFAGKFVVVAYPGSWRGNEAVLARLRALHFTVFESSAPMFDPNQTPGLRLSDGHPTRRAHDRVAQWLYEEMFLPKRRAS